MQTIDINHKCFKRVIVVTDFASIPNPQQLEKWIIAEGSLARATRALLAGRLDKAAFMKRVRAIVPQAKDDYFETFKATNPALLEWTANTLSDDHALNTDGVMAIAVDTLPMYWMTGAVNRDVFYFKGLSRSLVYEWTQVSRDQPYKTPRCSMPLVSYFVWYLRDHNPGLRTIYVQPSDGTRTILEALSPGSQVEPLAEEVELEDDGSIFTHTFEINDAVVNYWRLDADQQKRQKCIECGAIGQNLILEVGTWHRTFCDKHCQASAAARARSPHVKG